MTGKHSKIVFTPPAADVHNQREADLLDAKVKAADPQEAVLLYGFMLGDAEIIDSELRRLLFAGVDYRSRLRVVRAASLRLAERAAVLLGEAASK